MAKKKAKKFSSFLENPIDYTLLITVLNSNSTVISSV